MEDVVEDLGTDILEALAGLGWRGMESRSRISFGPEIVATDMDKHKVQLSVSDMYTYLSNLERSNMLKQTRLKQIMAIFLGDFPGRLFG